MKKTPSLSKLCSLSLVAALGFSLGACHSSSSTKEAASQVKEKTSTAKQAEKKTYHIGDKIVFDGKAEYTITKAEWTDERNQFESSFVKNTPEKVLKVTYNVTNLSDEDLVIGTDLRLYVNGNKMETYPNTNTAETISSGRSFEGAIEHFGVIGSGKMEIEIKPLLDFGAKPAIVEIEVP